MTSYLFYYLRDHRLEGSEEIQAGDDDGAIGVAEARSAGRTVEIWDGWRRVRVLAPVKTSLGPAQRQT
jgi:hypothetical protein